MGKKERNICISIVVVVGCLMMVLFPGETNYTSTIDPAKIVYYESADEVIADSVLIVRVKKISETPMVYHLEHDYQDRFTLSAVEVEEVFENSGNITIEVGDIIDILESQWTDEENKIIHHTEGYLKMEEGNQYLLLLGYNSSVNNYYPIGLLYGKIPIAPDETLFLSDGYKQVKEIIETLRQTYSS